MDWFDAIQAAAASRPPIIRAETFQFQYDTGAEPIRVTGDDSRTWVVKGAVAGRQIINEQIVGRLGLALGAPVPTIGLVDVGSDLLSVEEALQSPPNGLTPFLPGVWHGSLWIEGVSERRKLWERATDVSNEERFARLAFLYGWCCCEQDHQFLYSNSAPHLVYSVDHGHMFWDGPDWTVEALQSAPIAIPDKKIVSNCRLNRKALENAQQALCSLDVHQVVAQAVAAPLDQWGVSMAERIAMAEYLLKRHQELCASNLNVS